MNRNAMHHHSFPWPRTRFGTPRWIRFAAVAAFAALIAAACGVDTTTSAPSEPVDRVGSAGTVPAAEPTAPIPTVTPQPTPMPVNPTSTVVPADEPSPNDIVSTPTAPVIWESAATADRGITQLGGAASLFNASELANGAIVATGITPSNENAIFVWQPDRLDTPTVSVIRGEAIIGATTLDDEWVLIAVVDDFEAGDARVELHRLNSLNDGPVWVEGGMWAVQGQFLDLPGPQFLLASRVGEPTDTTSHQLVIRSVDDPEAMELLGRNYHSLLTLLSDGRVVSDAGLIFDPAEPERDPVDLDVFGVQSISELSDGRIVTGWLDEWRAFDPASASLATYFWEGLGAASPTAMPDGRMALNTTRGIELFDLDSLESPVAILRPPEDALTAGVFGIDLLFTATHAISLDDTASGIWVWDLEQDEQPAVPFAGGTPLIALADGRILSQSATGPIIWNPADLTQGSDAGLDITGPLCPVAAFDTTIWAGSETGAVIGWEFDGTGSPFAAVDFREQVVGLHAVDELLVVVSSTGLVAVVDPETATITASLMAPFAPVVSSAALSDGRIVVGSTEGAVTVVDPKRVDSQPLVLFEGNGSTATSVDELPGERVSAVLLDGVIAIFDARPGAETAVKPFAIELPEFATHHLATATGLMVVPGLGQMTAFDLADAGTAPRAIAIATDDYFAPVELGDGRIATVDGDGTVWVTDRTSEYEQFLPAARADIAPRSCLSPIGTDGLAITLGANVLVIQVPGEAAD